VQALFPYRTANGASYPEQPVMLEVSLYQSDRPHFSVIKRLSKPPVQIFSFVIVLARSGW